MTDIEMNIARQSELLAIRIYRINSAGHDEPGKLVEAEIAKALNDAFRAGMTKAAEVVGKESWKDGVPDKLHGQEWFIAKLDTGQRVVLRSLPEDFSYDYTTADETYYLATRIKKWMPFWDGDFKNPLEEAILTVRDSITTEDGE